MTTNTTLDHIEETHMSAMTANNQPVTATAENFPEPGEEYIAVNLRVGMIDADLSPDDAEDLARQLAEAAATLRGLNHPR